MKWHFSSSLIAEAEFLALNLSELLSYSMVSLEGSVWKKLSINIFKHWYRRVVVSIKRVCGY